MLGWIRIFPHDQTEPRTYRAIRPLSLQRAHRIVGGYVEAIPHWNQHLHSDGTVYDAVALCNEDGKGLGLPFNRQATIRWAHAINMLVPDLLRQDHLVGNILLSWGDLEYMEDWV